MIIEDVVKFLDEIAPRSFAENWDNVGLIIGDKKKEISSVLVCLEVTPEVVEEAISTEANLIVSHHPFIFKPMNKIISQDIKGKMIYSLIQNGISVYSMHTNFDVAEGGLNETLANKLDLTQIKTIKPHIKNKLYKLVVFVPSEHVDRVREAVLGAGAGWIGNYSNCSFGVVGTGTFMPMEGTNPYIGEKGQLENVKEIRLETIVTEANMGKVIETMINVHPYEEVAYDVYEVMQTNKEFGYAKIGMTKQETDFKQFINVVKEALTVESIRVIGDTNKVIKKVAVFCGAFDGDFEYVKRSGADVLVTGDVKYHTAVDIIQNGLLVIDAGHFNTEKIFVDRLLELLTDKFIELKVEKSMLEKDPFQVL